MNRLEQLVNESIYILREAYAEFANPAIMWSTGKDSTASLSLCREAFFGKVPFPVVHLDTTFKFPVMYEFRDRLAKEWDLDLIVARNDKAIQKGVSVDNGHYQCCNSLKTEALSRCIRERGFDAIILAIRRDEHGIRAKERHFSPRNSAHKWDYKNQPLEMWGQFQSALGKDEHMRIHPILSWTELDVWEYVKDRGLPVVSLYFAENGERYRSLGCQPCTATVASEADTIDKIVEELRETKIAERSGRAQDKENQFAMAKLRAMGYM